MQPSGSDGERDAGTARGPAAPLVRVVLITTPDEQTARTLARAWVERGLVACVNVVPAVHSVYRWQGAVEESRESLLIVKTTRANVAEIERSLSREHPYQTPECIVIAPEHVEARYAAWVLSACGAQAPLER